MSNNITAYIFTSSTPNNIFTQVASLPLPTLNIPLNVGTITHAINTSLSIPVTPQTRILIALAATTTGLGVAATITGYVSGGITIS